MDNLFVIPNKELYEKLKEALREAIEGWEYNIQYKNEYLIKKHGDKEDIQRLKDFLRELE